jgi:hypothetical protein
MTAPAYFVFDGDPTNGVVPRVPSVDDLGGANWVDDDTHPPNPEMDMSALDENQNELVLAGLARTAFVLCITVGFNAGAPVLQGMETVGSLLLSGDITLTDNGAGDTTISWPANKIPARTCGPLLTIHEDVEVTAQRALTPTATSIRVKTKVAGTGTDCGFTVRI